MRTDSGVPHNRGGESKMGSPGEGTENSVAEGGGRGADGVPVHDGVTWFEDC